jgi:hypothetical protein
LRRFRGIPPAKTVPRAADSRQSKAGPRQRKGARAGYIGPCVAVHLGRKTR